MLLVGYREKVSKGLPKIQFHTCFLLLNAARGVAEVLECLSVHLLWIRKDSVLKVLVNGSYELQKVGKC